MGLVDYSESDSSEPEAPSSSTTAPTPAKPNSKKTFQKVVDRSNPGKILVSLPQQASGDPTTVGQEEEGPPAKRARTGGEGKFSGFNSFLPAPKNANKPISRSSASAAGSTRPGFNLKTSAAPGFSREDDGRQESLGGSGQPASRGSQPAPSIPEEQSPPEEVKLVGKPLMFKPLSVARGTKKKKTPKSFPIPAAPQNQSKAVNAPQGVASLTNQGLAEGVPASAPKKLSLFSMHQDEEERPVGPTHQPTGTYEPMFEAEPAADSVASDQYQQLGGPSATSSAPADSESLDNIADDLHLSAAERRELFGRGGGNLAAKKVVNFNMDREYEHNESIRAQGDQQMHNPVRAIQGGKHSLRQLVQNVHNQREALEESFAKGKTNRKEASSKYGW